DRRQFEVVFLAALSIFLVIVATGVVRRWRWMFWLILVAFLAGVVRLPASAVELVGALPHQGRVWYVVREGVLGAVPFVLGVASANSSRAALAGVRPGFSRFSV